MAHHIYCSSYGASQALLLLPVHLSLVRGELFFGMDIVSVISFACRQGPTVLRQPAFLATRIRAATKALGSVLSMLCPSTLVLLLQTLLSVKFSLSSLKLLAFDSVSLGTRRMLDTHTKKFKHSRLAAFLPRNVAVRPDFARRLRPEQFCARAIAWPFAAWTVTDKC